MRFPAAIFALFLLALTAAAPAAVRLTAEVGWEGHYAPGRWTPLYVTASADPPRNAILTVSAPHSSSFGVVVRRGIGLSTQPATYPIFVPLGGAQDELQISLTDADTGRRLAEWPDREGGVTPMVLPTAGYGGPLIGTSGAFGPVRSIDFPATPRSPTLAPLAPDLLPTAAVGYDGLDLLILDRPNLSAMGLDQQQAIADWVRAGGRLLVWPGTDPVPAAGPLVDLLPLRFGTNQTLKLDAKTVAAAGLPARFSSIPARDTTAAEGARRVDVFGGASALYVNEAGFGSVGALPFDASSLLFADAETSAAFWRPVLGALIQIEKPGDGTPYYGYQGNRRGAAQSAVADVLGDVPGAGQFGFGYVVAVLAGLMLVVGPLDWLVLKKLGRQPWTWATTAGWILLVTLGAVYAGRVFKSGDLHYRTLRVVDEIDGRRVAATDVVGLYSPQTREYGLDAPADSWWQPLDTEQYGYGLGGGGVRTDVGFAEDSRGCRPTPMVVNVWNLRFLRGEQSLDGPGAVAADLRVVRKGKSPRLVGTITNRSGEALEGAVVYLEQSRARLAATIGPGETVAVDSPLLDAAEIEKIEPTPNPQNPPYAMAAVPTEAETKAGPPPLVMFRPTVLGAPGPDRSPNAVGLTTAACDIADGRSGRIEAMFKSGAPVAVVYAVAETPAVAGLTVPGAIERHRTIYRAVVRLGAE